MSRRYTPHAQILVPEIVRFSDGGDMISLIGPREHQWLTELPNGELGWSRNPFSGLAFTAGKEALLQYFFSLVHTMVLRVATQEEENTLAVS